MTRAPGVNRHFGKMLGCWGARFVMSSTLKSLRALSDATRLRMVALLERDELSVHELQEITHMGQSRISTHLGLLQEAGLVHSRRDGKRTFYKLNPRAPSPRPGTSSNWPSAARGNCRNPAATRSTSNASWRGGATRSRSISTRWRGGSTASMGPAARDRPSGICCCASAACCPAWPRPLPFRPAAPRRNASGFGPATGLLHPRRGGGGGRAH